MNSLDDLFFLPGEESTSGDGTIVLATVSAVDTDHGLTLTFDGDSSASQKKYKMLMNGRTPEVGDRVAAVKHSGTYIVLGVIGTNGGGGGIVTANPNTIYAGPASGESAGEATFRQLVAADLPGGGFVQKAGDTMTGTLDIKSTSLHENSPPSSGTNGTGIRFVDNEGNVMCDILPSMWSDGSMSLQLQAICEVNGTRQSNWLTITKRKNGDKELSLGTPLPLSSGGSGMASIQAVTSGIFTAATGFSVSSQSLYIWGHVAMFKIYIKKTTADSSTDPVVVGEFASGNYDPYVGEAAAVSSNGGNAYIRKPTATLPSKVYVRGPFDTSYFYVLATYLL